MRLTEWQKLISQSLGKKFDAATAYQLSKILLMHYTGAKSVDFIVDGSHKDIPSNRWKTDVSRLLNDEPWQYVIGECDFCGLKLLVNQEVLIPRPETEELVYWVEDMCKSTQVNHIVDICTGSGCMALALKKKFPGTQVTGWDTSPGALAIGKKNALVLNLEVEFELKDALAASSYSNYPNTVDVVVSNPPYVTHAERHLMQPNVLNYEPHVALFVPGHDALLFYKAIAAGSKQMLRIGGRVFFEINEAYAYEVYQLLQLQGFELVEVKKDFRGKPRMVSGIKSH